MNFIEIKNKFIHDLCKIIGLQFNFLIFILFNFLNFLCYIYIYLYFTYTSILKFIFFKFLVSEDLHQKTYIYLVEEKL